MMGLDMDISVEERLFLVRVLGDVLGQTAFFSLGEMATVTGWSVGDVEGFTAALQAGRTTLSSSEQRFIGQTLYAWSVSARTGRIQASDEDVQVGDELNRRRKELRRGGR